MTSQLPIEALGLVLKAIAFAAQQHRDQRRKDADAPPYVNHPIAVANLLCNEAGITDVDVICSALLHDTIEDTDTTEEELETLFGPSIAQIVHQVSDDTRLPRLERKRLQVMHASQLCPQARLVKLADKICNLRDIALSPPVGWPLERRREYFEWAAKVVDQIRGTHPELESIFDAAYSAIPE